MGVHGFLADTNIISETYKPTPDPIVAHWIRRNPELIISYPVIFELEWGICNKNRDDPAGALKLRLWLDRILESSERLLTEMTAAVAQRQADMMQVPSLRDLWMSRPKASRPPGQDLTIAALAIENQLPIATNDCGDFLRINAHFPLPGVFTPAVQAWIVPRTQKSRLRRGTPPTAFQELVPT